MATSPFKTNGIRYFMLSVRSNKEDLRLQPYLTYNRTAFHLGFSNEVAYEFTPGLWSSLSVVIGPYHFGAKAKNFEMPHLCSQSPRLKSGFRLHSNCSHNAGVLFVPCRATTLCWLAGTYAEYCIGKVLVVAVKRMRVWMSFAKTKPFIGAKPTFRKPSTQSRPSIAFQCCLCNQRRYGVQWRWTVCL